MFNLLFKKPKEPAEIKKLYNIPETIHLNIRIDNGWFLVSSNELPGLITQARTAEELLEMVNDAILTYYDVPKREAKEVFDTVDIEGLGTITSKKKVLVAN